MLPVRCYGTEHLFPLGYGIPVSTSVLKVLALLYFSSSVICLAQLASDVPMLCHIRVLVDRRLVVIIQQ